MGQGRIKRHWKRYFNRIREQCGLAYIYHRDSEL